jgi:hypothetical protein
MTNGKGLGLVEPIYRACLRHPNIRFMWAKVAEDLIGAHARPSAFGAALSNCAKAAKTPSISFPVEVSSIGSVAERNEMPSDFKCARRAK